MSDLLPGREGTSAVSLLDDADVGLLVGRRMGSELLSFEGVVFDLPVEQVLCLASMADFADSSEECTCVAGMICQLMRITDILPLVTEHRGMDLASRCLISLSLFKKTMETRHKKRGAPQPCFYREVGSTTLKRLNHRDVAEHFTKWEIFLQEIFVTGG